MMFVWKSVCFVMMMFVASVMFGSSAWAEGEATASASASSETGFLTQSWFQNYAQRQFHALDVACVGASSDCRRRRWRRWRRPLSPEERERRSARKMIIAGWSLFGSAYGTAVVVGGLIYAGFQHPMLATTFIPLVGPVLTGVYIFQNLIRPGTAHGLEIIANLFMGMWAVLNFVLAIAQTTGLILAIIGHSRANRLHAGMSGDDVPRGATWQIAPWATHDSAGLAVAGRF